MSTRGLSAHSNLGENIMGNWRITGFTGAIFGLTESGGFWYSVCACCPIYRHLYGFYDLLGRPFGWQIFLGRVSDSVSYGYLLEWLWPDFTYLPFTLSQLITPQPYTWGLSYSPFVLFSTHSDLLLVNETIHSILIGILPDERRKCIIFLIFHLSRHSHYGFRVIANSHGHSSIQSRC